MHKIIGVFVYAYNKEDAMGKARNVFDRLVNMDIYDYCTTFEVESLESTGRGRWGDITPVMDVDGEDNEEARKLIEELFTGMWNDFIHSVNKLRHLLDRFTNEELFEESMTESSRVEIKLSGDSERDEQFHLTLFPTYAHRLSRYPCESSDVRMYDQDGETIENRSQLNQVLGKWGNAVDIADKRTYFVPADVHF